MALCHNTDPVDDCLSVDEKDEKEIKAQVDVFMSLSTASMRKNIYKLVLILNTHMTKTWSACVSENLIEEKEIFLSPQLIFLFVK